MLPSAFLEIFSGQVAALSASMIIFWLHNHYMMPTTCTCNSLYM